MGIRYKLLLSVLAAVIAVFGALWAASYFTSKEILLERIKARAEGLRDSNIADLDARLKAVQDVAEGIAATAEIMDFRSTNDAGALIKGFLSVTPEAYGSTLAFAPYKFPGKDLFCPYYYRKDGGLAYDELSKPSYNYIEWDWFKLAVSREKPFWSEPYMDVGGGNVAMVTYSNPFFKKGEFWGVTTVDMALSDLTEMVRKMNTGKDNYGLLISRTGMLLSVFEKNWELKKTIFDIAKDAASDDTMALGTKMISGETGFMRFANPINKKMSWFGFGPIPTTGWSLLVITPESELMSDLWLLHHRMIGIGIAGILIIAVVIFFLSGRISRPIKVLADGARRIAEGDFSAKLPESASGRDEISQLTRSFGRMQGSLSDTLARLREESELLKAAFSHMTEGVVLLDPKCNILQYNLAAERLLMLPTKAPIIEHLQAHFDSSAPLSNLSCEKENIFKLSRRESENLGPLHLGCVASPICDAKNKICHRLLSVSNITEFEVEERSKRDFLSLMSHKLFTPITVLEGKIMLFKDGLLGQLDTKQQKGIGDMAHQAIKLKNLIEELVNYVTIEGSSLDMSREKIDLNEMLGTISQENSLLYPDKHPEIRFSVAEGMGEVNFNGKYLRLIIGHLVENGLKFNMSDPATVDISCRREGNALCVAVTDNGIGIPPEFYDKIFEKFYQIDKYFTGNVEGVGLGLAYVKRLVDAFGGKIGLTSEPGKGSTFTVKIPLV